MKQTTILAGTVMAGCLWTNAATFYWDQNGNTLGFGTGTGTWAEDNTSPGPGRWTINPLGQTAGSLTEATGNTDSFNFGSATHGLGAGTIAVSGAVNMGSVTYHSLSGSIVLSGGTINFGDANTITVNNTTNTISSVIGGAATSLTKAGSGSLVLTGANTFTGNMNVNLGTIDLGGGTSNGSLASAGLALRGGSLHYTRTGTNTQSFTTTDISGGGTSQISVVSGNTLDLGTVTRGAGGAFNFANVGGGTVAASAASNDATGIMGGFTHGNSWAVANGAGLEISGLASASYTLSSVAGGAAANYLDANIDVNNSPGTLDASFAANSLRFSAAAANTLSLTGDSNVITSGGILVGSGVGANLSTITGGTLAGAASKDLAIIQNNTSGGLTISSVIGDNTGPTALTKSGAGLLTLDNANTFTGGVFIHGGRVSLANAGALNSTAGSENSVTFGTGSTGTLTLSGNSVVLRSLGSTDPKAPGTAVVENASGADITLTIGNDAGAHGTFGGVIRDGTGGGKLSLVKTGTGTLGLAGANTYTGGTTLSGGTVTISNSASFGAGNVSVTGSSRINVTGNLTYANAIDVGAALTLQIPNASQGTATFTGQLTGSGPINVLAVNANNITGTYAFTHINNSFTGNVAMPAGSTSTSASGLDFFTFNSIGDGGNFTFQKSGHTGGIAYTGASAITFNSRQIALGEQFGGVFNGGGVVPVNMFQNNGTGTVTFNTNLTPGAIFSDGTFFFGGSNTGDNTFSGVISNPSNFNLGIGKVDTGKWILTGASTYLGDAKVARGTLSVNAIAPSTTPQPLGQGSIMELGHQNTTGTLEFTGTSNSTTDKQVRMGNSVANIGNSGGAVILNNGSGSLTFTNPTFNPTVASVVATRTLTLGGTYAGSNEIQGVIQDNVASTGKVALTVSGSTWKISGNNTYTGATNVTGGTLIINGSTSTSSTVTVGTGGTLGGSGTVGGATTVNGILAPGQSPGTLTLIWLKICQVDIVVLSYHFSDGLELGDNRVETRSEAG